MALASLLDVKGIAQTTNPLAPKQPHFPARAKRVIYLFQPARLHSSIFRLQAFLYQIQRKPAPPDLLKDRASLSSNPMPVSTLPNSLSTRLESPAQNSQTRPTSRRV
jgi:hypothetical protein